MADQLRRSDRSDQNRYDNLDQPANQNTKQQPARSPGWTQYGDIESQQMSALKYNKAAQEHLQQRQAANTNVQESRKEAYYREMAQKLATTQKDRGPDQAREQQRTRGRDMDLSR